MSTRHAMRNIWNLLRSTDTAVVLLLSLSFLFGIATFVREAAPDAYEGLFGDDLRFFLEGFRAIDLWFWIIALFCLFLGVSLAACAIDRFATRIRRRSRDPRDYATILLHAGVGIALLAHLIGGLGGGAAMVPLDTRYRTIGDREIRVIDGTVETYRDGSVRSQRVWMETRDREGRSFSQSTAPNDPATWNGGRDLLLLMRFDRRATAAVLRIGGQVDTVGVGIQRRLPGGGFIVVEQLFGPPEFRIPVARVRVAGGNYAGTHLIGRGMTLPVPDLELQDLAFSPAALVNHRRAPATPCFLAAVIVLSIGSLLLAARWLRAEVETFGAKPRERGGINGASTPGND